MIVSVILNLLKEKFNHVNLLPYIMPLALKFCKFLLISTCLNLKKKKKIMIKLFKRAFDPVSSSGLNPPTQGLSFKMGRGVIKSC